MTDDEVADVTLDENAFGIKLISPFLTCIGEAYVAFEESTVTAIRQKHFISLHFFTGSQGAQAI